MSMARDSLVDGIRAELSEIAGLDAASARTMPSAFYTSPEFLKLEEEHLLRRQWLCVGHIGEIPQLGDFFTTELLGEQLLVVRDLAGEVRVLSNVCRHRGNLVAEGKGNTKRFICQYHAWTYRTDGSLLRAPFMEDVKTFDPKGCALPRLACEIWNGFVFVNLDPEARSLASQAQGLEAEMRRYCPEIDKLKFAYRLTYEIAANWKNVVDNYLECYHCATAHPDFADLVDIPNYRSVTYDIHSSHIAPAGRADNTAYSVDPASFDGDDGTPNSFAGWWLWPNLTFNIFPGPPNITSLHIMPTGPETTLEHFDCYFLDSEPRASERQAIEYMDKVLQPEDIGLVESVQRGLRSRGYQQGRFMVDETRSHLSEHAVHHFHNLVMNALRT